MPQKSVAVAADVSASAGTAPYTGAETGSWTAGPVQCQSHAKLTIGGTATVWKASCMFSFTGASSSGAAIAGTSSVQLTASATSLQGGGNNVLRDGDETSDSYGNRLSVGTGGKLRSA